MIGHCKKKIIQARIVSDSIVLFVKLNIDIILAPLHERYLIAQTVQQEITIALGSMIEDKTISVAALA